jgi:hypothetical protein
MASERPRASERRLKFSSVRGLEGRNGPQQTSDTVVLAAPEKRSGPLAGLGGLLTAAYVAVARRVLIGFEVVQDRRAARRAVALRRSARADAASSVRNDMFSLGASSNSRGDDRR